MTNKLTLNTSPITHIGYYKYEAILWKDGKSYVVKPDNKGVYHWIEMTLKDNVDDFYAQIPSNLKRKFNITEILDQINNIKQELEKANIYLVFVKWNECYSDSKYAEKLVCEDKIPELLDPIKISVDKIKKTISYIFLTDYDIYWAERSGLLNITHSILEKDLEFVQKIFIKYLKKRIKHLVLDKIEIKLPKVEKK
jgi:hypothetical protein